MPWPAFAGTYGRCLVVFKKMRMTFIKCKSLFREACNGMNKTKYADLSKRYSTLEGVRRDAVFS